MTALRQVRKAVLPVAGLGTRFLPATKAQPKEVLPLVDKPLIQYAVEEAVASGIEEIILVTGPGKQAIEDYFRRDPELERELEARGKKAEAELVRRVAELARIRTVEQPSALGLGHAVGCARRLVAGEPFAVLLPDDLIDAAVPATRQLLDVYDARGGCVIATEEVLGAEIEKYGVMAVEDANQPERPAWRGRLFRVRGLVEKPRPADAPSPYVVVGRYILEPEIFDLIEKTSPGRGGEIQLTDALAAFARQGTMHAYRFEGTHFDAGNKAGFVAATLHFALQHPDVAPALRAFLKNLKD